MVKKGDAPQTLPECVSLTPEQDQILVGLIFEQLLISWSLSNLNKSSYPAPTVGAAHNTQPFGIGKHILIENLRFVPGFHLVTMVSG